ncbi:hypothetical protein HB364_12635 [Pseudoflavitalea sp. X16]|uniref:hypothetical protein n=1 Tax=Paraflavitalea devenefica TaxID=2716334 RepID=UPI00141E7B43|nr:hypothetical protein [Paraflavitalea devenefica]NII25934.1 hypothetical protein [Paraflavitalea devenefica]
MINSNCSIQYQRSIFLIAGFLWLLTACTKTTTNPYPPQSQSRILSYKIVNTTTPITGVVDDNDHTITVYLGPTLFLSILEPQITVSEGASISPASGTFIENLADYFAKGRTIQYTVTGKDKSVSTYSLHIISQQPPLSFQEVTTDPADPVTYNHSISWYANSIPIYTTTPYLFSPSNIVSQAVGRVSLVAENGTEYPMTADGAGAPAFAGAGVTSYSHVIVNLSGVIGYDLLTGGANQTSPPPGLYRIKVQYYSRTTTLKNPIRIIYE